MYQFNNRDLLENPEKYHYAHCNAPDFPTQWRQSRKKWRETLLIAELSDKENNFSLTTTVGEIDTFFELNRILATLNSNPASLHKLLFFLKKFEVSKRLYGYYSKDKKAITRSHYRNLDIYLLFGRCLVLGYEATNNLQFLSTFLKLMDTLTSINPEAYTTNQANEIFQLLDIELKIMTPLLENDDHSV